MNIKRETIEKITVDFTSEEEAKINETLVGIGGKICMLFWCSECPFAIKSFNECGEPIQHCVIDGMHTGFWKLKKKEE